MTLFIMMTVGIVAIGLVTGIAWYFDIKNIDQIDDMSIDD
jgi:hypothetical protein